MGKSKKRKLNNDDLNDITDVNNATELNETTESNELNETNNNLDSAIDDDSLIDFLIENNQVNNNDDINDEANKSDQNDESDDDEENRYNGLVLNRKEYFEQIYLKYAKNLYDDNKERIAKNLKKKIKVVLGEGRDKNKVFVNDEPILIDEKIQLDYKEIIALQLTQTRLGFSYFCSFYDERFNRICFQAFKDKREVIDHYYSLHLNKLKNYFCKECKQSYVFYKQMKGHLIKSHSICTNFDNYLEPISYYFESRCQIKSIKDKESMKIYRHRLIEKP